VERKASSKQTFRTKKREKKANLNDEFQKNRALTLCTSP